MGPIYFFYFLFIPNPLWDISWNCKISKVQGWEEPVLSLSPPLQNLLKTQAFVKFYLWMWILFPLILSLGSPLRECMMLITLIGIFARAPTFHFLQKATHKGRERLWAFRAAVWSMITRSKPSTLQKDILKRNTAASPKESTFNWVSKNDYCHPSLENSSSRWEYNNHVWLRLATKCCASVQKRAFTAKACSGRLFLPKIVCRYSWNGIGLPLVWLAGIVNFLFPGYMDNIHRPGNRLVILHSVDLSKISGYTFHCVFLTPHEVVTLFRNGRVSVEPPCFLSHMKLVIFVTVVSLLFAEDGESSSNGGGQSFQLTQSKIKGLEDKYRWKLNELGVSFQTRFVLSARPSDSNDFLASLCVWWVHIYELFCVCVCKRERERKKERKKERNREFQPPVFDNCEVFTLVRKTRTEAMCTWQINTLCFADFWKHSDGEWETWRGDN